MAQLGITYINSKLTIQPDIIRTDYDGSEVMGVWEKPLMYRYAELVNQSQGHILEVGFGLGLFASRCHQIGCKSYTIVESHPDILPYLFEWSKDKPEVSVIAGDWHDCLEEINSQKYDSIFFDTHLDPSRPKFRSLVVDQSLDNNGVFGYFTMGDGDVFEYGDKLQTETMKLKTSTDSDYGGAEMEFIVSTYTNIN